MNVQSIAIFDFVLYHFPSYVRPSRFRPHVCVSLVFGGMCEYALFIRSDFRRSMLVTAHFYEVMRWRVC